MPRSRKRSNKVIKDTKLTKNAREGLNEMQEAPEPVEVSKVPSIRAMKRQPRVSQAALSQAMKTPLLADDDEDFPANAAAAKGSSIGGKPTAAKSNIIWEKPTNAMPSANPAPRYYNGKRVARVYKMLEVPFTKHIVLFQFPNRGWNQPYNEANHQKPLELRIKPKCGLVEMDIPINVHANFDKEKGILYGEAMRKSQVLQEGGSYGPAGGLGIGGSSRPAKADNRTSGNDEFSVETLLENFEDANNKGHVMNKITLGGQIIPFKEGEPLYFIGAFRGDELHLSRVSAIVQMRPKLGHVDALADQKKTSSRAQQDPDYVYPESEARAVNMTVKSSDGEELDMSETAKLLRAMQEEPWRRMSWVDEEDARAYQVYNSTMFHPDAENAPQLISTMTNEEWLDAISAPRVDPTRLGKKVMMTMGSDECDTSTDAEPEDEEEDETEEEADDEDDAVHSGDDAAHSGDDHTDDVGTVGQTGA
ncbi:DNA-directed RNA polymerase III subunit Rpc5 [Lasallia pustulata]|uniref:DNA-directed RNA polymerase III subunit Rpc5 n=1 Tax=Lasallia pustulata TaxID=136370 RepID=A0A1W5D8U5_9LECA|nr:DNA-directed RNA polymerase III subunit Rpc5 [Lasallia pustulata]